MNGIAFAQTSMQKNDLIFDTRKQTVTVDMEPGIKHADILRLNAGTILTGTTLGQNITETIWSIPHNMPFRPRVEGFFTVTAIPTDRYCEAVIGSYQKSLLMISVNNVGYGTEQVQMKVDGFQVSLVHTATVGGTGTFNGCGNLLKFDFRYLITNQPSVT